jgi:hypothetical protein
MLTTDMQYHSSSENMLSFEDLFPRETTLMGEKCVCV